jgi:abscisic-aldehyde oxidase
MATVQVEGAFVQGIGFFMTEDVEMKNGTLVSDGTWTYKVPTVDTIPQRFHVELYNGPAHQHRVLSSKGTLALTPELLMGCLFFMHNSCRSCCFFSRRPSAFDVDVRFWFMAAVGEPPLLLAGSVHMAIQSAIKAARKENARWCAQPNVEEESKHNTNIFRLDTPATVDRIKLLCGLDNVESYLEALVRMEHQPNTDSSVNTIE